MSVFCPCREPQKSGANETPKSLKCAECYFSVNSLLFCDECQAVRCRFCTISEPVTWFCSRCLAETTKTEARTTSNGCARSCVRCPDCHASSSSKPVDNICTLQPKMKSGGAKSQDAHNSDKVKGERTFVKAEVTPINEPNESIKDKYSGRSDVESEDQRNIEAEMKRDTANKSEGPNDDVAEGNTEVDYKNKSANGIEYEILDQLNKSEYTDGKCEIPGWVVNCLRCEYANGIPKINDSSSAESCMALRRQNYNNTLEWAAGSLNPTVSFSESLPKELHIPADTVPLPVSLRARWTKRCKQCQSVLVQPAVNTPANMFDKKSSARSELPCFERFGNRIIVRNFSRREMNVQLAALDAVLSPAAFAITPLPETTPDAALRSFPAPICLTERESLASRQALISQRGEKNMFGAGWVMVEIDEKRSEPSYVFCSTEFDQGSVQTWIKLSLE